MCHWEKPSLPVSQSPGCSHHTPPSISKARSGRAPAFAKSPVAEAWSLEILEVVLIPGTLMVEGKNQRPQVVSDLHTHAVGTHKRMYIKIK